MNLLMFWHASGIEHYHDRFNALAFRFDSLTVAISRDFKETKVIPQSSNFQTLILRSIINLHPSLFIYTGIRNIEWNNYDVVWIHEELHSLSTFQIALFCKWNKIPFIVESAVINKKVNFFGLNILERYVMTSVYAVCYRNNDVKEVLIERGLKENKLGIMLFNGVSLSSNESLVRIDKNQRIKIGFVGRLFSAKGVLVLAEALVKLNMEVDLVIVGREIEDGIVHKTKQIYQRTDYRGELGYDKLSRLYESLDILVLPSIPTKSWTEQFGRVLSEAIVHGTYACGSRIGAIPDIVGLENTFKPNSAVAIEEFLRDLITNQDILELWKIQYSNVEFNYTWEKQAELMESIAFKASKRII